MIDELTTHGLDYQHAPGPERVCVRQQTTIARQSSLLKGMPSSGLPLGALSHEYP